MNPWSGRFREGVYLAVSGFSEEKLPVLPRSEAEVVEAGGWGLEWGSGCCDGVRRQAGGCSRVRAG